MTADDILAANRGGRVDGNVIAVIKTGDSIPSLVNRRGDFEDWIISGLGNRRSVDCPVTAVHDGEALPDFSRTNGIVVTGSHAMVTDHADWSDRTADWLATAVARDLPILGICYGHQLLAYALGGKVGPTPGGPEFGTVPVRLMAEAQTDPLFRQLPSSLDVYTSHYQSVTALPPAATLLASSDKDPHSAFRYGNRAWGVQFHPEYDLDIANAYLNEYYKNRQDAVDNESEAPEQCTEANTGKTILSRFADLVVEESQR